MCFFSNLFFPEFRFMLMIPSSIWSAEMCSDNITPGVIICGFIYLKIRSSIISVHPISDLLISPFGSFCHQLQEFPGGYKVFKILEKCT